MPSIAEISRLREDAKAKPFFLEPGTCRSEAKKSSQLMKQDIYICAYVRLLNLRIKEFLSFLEYVKVDENG